MGCRVTLSANQTGIGSDYDQINFDVETFDIAGNFNTTTNQFTAPVAGYYLVGGCVSFGSSSATSQHVGCIRLNNSTYMYDVQRAFLDNTYVGTNYCMVTHLAANDLIDTWACANYGTGGIFCPTNDNMVYMFVWLLKED